MARGSADGAMVGDLVAALVQLRDPITTTIQVARNGDAVFQTVVEELVRAGYGIQRVDADQGANFLAVVRDPESSAGGQTSNDTVVYWVSVGDIELRREYRVLDATHVVPRGPLQVSGSRANVQLDDQQFGIDDDPAISRTVYTASLIEDIPPPPISIITEDVVRGVAASATGNIETSALNSRRVEVTNRFFDDEGSFKALWAERERISRDVILFANDSMRLGEVGKQQIRDILRAFNEDSDIIGLVGCSNGKTQLDIGNEGLALGRSQRVAEEFLALGVSRDRIIDEGCWSPVSAGVRFPARGVVVDIWRSPS